MSIWATDLSSSRRACWFSASRALAASNADAAVDTRAFVRKYKVTYPVALDPKLTIGNTFGFKGTPYTVVISQRGEIAAQLTGESAVARLPKILDDLLKESAPPRS